MAKYLDVDKTLDLVNEILGGIDDEKRRYGLSDDWAMRQKCDWSLVHDFIFYQPAADVRPVVRGSWIKLSRGDVCSECNYSTGRNGYGGNFCPNCGADMRDMDCHVADAPRNDKEE